MSIQIWEDSTRMVFLILLSPSSFETWANRWITNFGICPNPLCLPLRVFGPGLISFTWGPPPPDSLRIRLLRMRHKYYLSLFLPTFSSAPSPLTDIISKKLYTPCAELHLLLFSSLSSPLFLYLAVRLPFPLPVPTFSNSRCVVTNSVMSCS